METSCIGLCIFLRHKLCSQHASVFAYFSGINYADIMHGSMIFLRHKLCRHHAWVYAYFSGINYADTMHRSMHISQA